MKLKKPKGKEVRKTIYNKKWLIVVGVSVIFLGLWWIGQRGFDSGDWAIYENDRYGFAVDYPASWTLGEAPTNNDGREFISPDKKITCRGYGFANSLTGESGEPQTLEEFSDWMLTEEIIVWAGKEETTLDDEKAMELIWETEDQKQGYGLSCVFKSEEARKAWEIAEQNRISDEFVERFNRDSSN